MANHKAVIPPRSDNFFNDVADRLTHRYRTFFEVLADNVDIALRGSELFIDPTADNVNAKAYGRYIKFGGAVTFPAAPDHADTVYIKSTSTTIFVSGGGKNIDGAPSANVTALSSKTFIYDSNTDQWYTM